MFLDGMFRGWTYSMMSYSILWRHKRLLIFPILAGIAGVIVTASFLVPLRQVGTIDYWLSDTHKAMREPGTWGMLFLFYLANYFVIVFFNAALMACGIRYSEGGQPSIKEGLAVATRRIVQIFAWALLSAVVGVLLRSVEKSDKVGRFISAILGASWTIMTFFVVPVIVIEGAGPFGAIKGSLKTLKSHWGEALEGHFSLAFINFLIAIPVLLLAFVLFGVSFGADSPVLSGICLAAAVMLFMLTAAAASAADTIFKGLLFSYATDKGLPEEVNQYRAEFDDAFMPTK